MNKHIAGIAVTLLAVTGALAAPACTPTGFVRDGINLTAAVINPVGSVSGDVDGSGCNIVVYYDHGSGAVKNANIHGANYYGVVVNGDISNVSVDITNSSVHDIGDTPFSGDQHGVAVYYRAFGSATTSGKISNNTISSYQKGGIVVNGASSATIQDNVVTGLGRVIFIAGNGIQVGYGANAQVMRNTVTGNAYTGLNSASSGGILVVGGDCYGGALTTGTQIVGNTLVNNDVGVFLSNLDASCAAPTTATNVKAINNTITNDALTNLGSGHGDGYQAGVSDVGNNDKIITNTISGAGYTAPGNAATYAIPVDASTTFTNRPKVHANK
jgi:parallel beta-helix repeat protein